MSDNLKVEESFVEALLEQAAWAAARIELSEGKTAKKEATTRAGTPGNSTADLDLSDDEPEEDEEDEDSVGRMGNHDEMKEKKVKEKKKVKEATEEHTCPLCESILEEELSDEQIMEHVAQIQSAMATIEEGGDEDDEYDVEPTDDDLDAIENEGKKTKKESVMKKVKELKKSAAGK